VISSIPGCPTSDFLGLKIVGVLLRTATFLPLIEQKLGDQCDVQVGGWETANMLANVVLIDGPALGKALKVASRSGARLILS
jgi:hypothetical protein